MSPSDNPIIEQSPVTGIDASARAWQAFRSADSARVFCERWLECLHLEHSALVGGLVLIADESGGDFAPLARWPQNLDAATLVDCGEQALADGGREVTTGSPGGVALAFPIFVFGELRALALFEAQAALGNESLRARLRWSLAWIEVLLLRRLTNGPENPNEQPIYRALECFAAIVDKQTFQSSANALVSELAAMFSCDRVSLGFIDSGDSRLVALSDTAVFGQQMNLVALIEAAMDEALDQNEMIVWPPPSQNAFMVTLAHDALSQQAADSSICTIPLFARDKAIGALSLEYGEGKEFNERDAQLLDVVAALCAAPLIDRRDAERWLVGIAWDRARDQLLRLFGPGYSGRKLVLGFVLLLITAASLWTTNYRVNGEAVLRGAEQRAITAPIDGYVASAPARAGDRLPANALLLTLDDRDISIERLKTATERAELIQQRKLAVATRERASAKVYDAQIAQADARLALLDEQIARTVVTMPFAGFIVSGDFTQSLGTPLRRGDLLFEIAPSDSYRVVIDVDESQLDEVTLDARGTLRLNALPEAAFDIIVTRITPVTKAREGGNYFEVEAELTAPSDRFRPGMRGIGKIDIGERNLVWVWTRAMRTWLTLQWWRWWP